MKKIMLIVALFVCASATNVDAGYYRTKNTFTGRYQSTGRVNSMGTRRAPVGYHTNSWGRVQKNSLY